MSKAESPGGAQQMAPRDRAVHTMSLPRFTAAAVQAAPVFLDAPATVEKARELMLLAAANGAELVAFPEVFVPGYPYWNWTMTPVQGGAWFEELYLASVDLDGPEVAALCAAAREAGTLVVIGVNERAQAGVGTLYNSVLVIDETGTLLGVHRKLVPTWAEKLTWAHGDGSSLRVYDTRVGPLGVLACGENTNTLARFALLARGELIHVANYIALPTAPESYDMVEAIKTRSAAHAFEGKVFNIVSCSTISPEMIAAVAGDDSEARKLLSRPHSAFSGIFGPDGSLVSDPLIDDEGIVYAEIDLNRCIQPKQMHDIIGHYNRFDIFDLRVDTSRRQSATFFEDSASGHGSVGPQPQSIATEPDDIPTAQASDEESAALHPTEFSDRVNLPRVKRSSA